METVSLFRSPEKQAIEMGDITASLIRALVQKLVADGKTYHSIEITIK